jgi:hypothetical protein
MLKGHIQNVRIDDPGAEDPAATRERLKARFAPGAARRMTQLGMMVGALLRDLRPDAQDALVYATQYGESRALENYIDSFPTPSPTLFQTSIHPSGAQQYLIGNQRSLREFFPLAGGESLVASALQAALLSASPRVLLCGGEEQATWLTANSLASDRSFAFAMATTNQQTADTCGLIELQPDNGVSGTLSLHDWFMLVRDRRHFSGCIAPGWRIKLDWF